MKRRRFGYGWTPATWQSWLFIVMELVIIFTAVTFLFSSEQPTTSELLRFFVILGAVIITLFIFTTQTGPKAKWRWGKKPNDNPNEDF